MTKGLGRLLRHGEAGPLLGLVVLCGLFQILSEGKFFTFGQLSSVAALSASLGLVSLRVTMLMISGEFDLSVSQTFALAPIVMGILIRDHLWPDAAAFAMALLAVLSIGLINGLITTLASVPSFIVTLGMLFAITSLNRMLAGGFPVEVFEHEGALLKLMGGDLTGTPFSAPFLWMLVASAVLWFVLRWTRYGNWSSAAGHHGGQVARAMGVPIAKMKLINFILCAGLAGLAGCLQLADFGSSGVNSGENYNLLAIVAVVMGGTSLFGVKGTIFGTILGAIMLGTLRSGLILVGTSGQYYSGLIGALLLVAAVINARVDSLHLSGRERISLLK